METSSTTIGTSDPLLKKGIEVPLKLINLRQKLGEKARNEPKFRFYSLYGQICQIDVLRTAWKLIKGHGKTPGVDGISYEDIEGYEQERQEQRVEAFLNQILEELKNKTYKPMPVRRIFIPKQDGTKRPLGIPTIKDRLVQMAFVLIIEPIFETDFLDCSHGFRPERSAHDAIRDIVKNVKEKRIAIYDADMKGYFDSIPHDKLMACLRKRITDSSVLKVIEQWLKAPVVEKEKDDKDNWQVKVTKPTKGTPQGGVISPLLANLYLHWFDKRFHNKQDGLRYTADARLVRYADDFVAMARNIGESFSGTIQGILETWMGLEINKEKTRIVTLKEVGSSIDFVGFTMRVERSQYGYVSTYVRIEPKKKAIQKAKDRIKELTSKSKNCYPIKDMIGELNRFLIGWAGYFSLGHPSRVFGKLDCYVGEKVVRNLKKRSQRAYKKPENQTWGQHLEELGLVRIASNLAEANRRAGCGKSACPVRRGGR